ncbi:MAG TPA: DUF2442 domain-containing protein [Candidatus Polarisedimenticolia bacterium]|nr:DUF2442 domain-containing protein [Candidatus Polarisedimenticolia bacterium]
MLHDVVEVRSLGAKRVFLRFEDGVSGEIDLANRIEFVGVFAPLLDEREFAKVRVDPNLGTIVWPGGADLAPETLYAWLTGGNPGASVTGAG